ncbi:Sialic acid TRAP transporter permease protein SiaT [Roseivivax jejudonensis]|uniref:TRAP transporter large permease protein n=1 Tax=Roseivivax jejudonensis TaxID=1529041 RepID=A0A1X7A5I7_9RHOB|nr:TRAP transporter large permease [Roseivivax jejudonensis]SLN70875.1 Sialic acid TRAP transporter permease protein SiaT [Roseivivax jejudonensis]
MTGVEIGLVALAGLMTLLALRMPVGLAMLLVGALGIAAIRPPAVMPVVAAEIFSEGTSYALTILPLFILMGNLSGLSGMSRDLYDAANAWIGHKPGGLASATILGCAAFSALSGSSLAAALTMGRVSMPEMERYDYAPSLATGAVAAGGTLGILIPPSAGFVIYAILTEVSIEKLFLAGVVPGIMLTALFVFAIQLSVRARPSLAPKAAERSNIGERLRTTGRASAMVGIIVCSIGGIYAGAFSAVEAAGVGAALAFLVALARRALSVEGLSRAARQTLSATGSIFLILFGAFVFKTFIAFTGIPFALVDMVEAAGLSQGVLILTVLAALIVLGTFLDGFAILVLTVPILQPILEASGVDMIWFGVLLVITLEMALISPPVGMNVFVVKSLKPDLGLGTVYRGVMPFWIAMALAIAVLLVLPGTATWLPDSMS